MVYLEPKNLRNKGYWYAILKKQFHVIKLNQVRKN